MFSIEFITPPKVVQNLRRGVIIIDNYKEQFEASLSFWTPNDYQSHWRQALNRILTGAERSCLITSTYDPKSANFLFWWPLYRDNTTVYIQNQVLFLDTIGGIFRVADCYSYIPARRTHSDSGAPISEWSTNITDIQSFLKCR
jgi:hypothetical protein